MCNFRSMLPKQDQLCAFIESCSADIVLGTETWLTSDINNTELSLSKAFTIFRRDRVAARGGGVVVAVKNRFRARVVPTSSDIEILWVLIEMCPSVTCAVGVCYRPPDSPQEFVENLNDSLSAIQDKYPSSPIILGGDFNYPAIDWQSYTPLGGTRKKECKEFFRWDFFI